MEGRPTRFHITYPDLEFDYHKIWIETYLCQRSCNVKYLKSCDLLLLAPCSPSPTLFSPFRYKIMIRHQVMCYTWRVVISSSWPIDPPPLCPTLFSPCKYRIMIRHQVMCSTWRVVISCSWLLDPPPLCPTMFSTCKYRVMIIHQVMYSTWRVIISCSWPIDPLPSVPRCLGSWSDIRPCCAEPGELLYPAPGHLL